MRNKRSFNKSQQEPLLYYKSREDIEAYRRKPVKYKLQWLETQMEFFHKAMPDKAKKIRDELNQELKSVLKKYMAKQNGEN